MSCNTKCKPLATLACNDTYEVKDSCDTGCGTNYNLGAGIGNLILWFIIIAVIVWFILWSLRPAWVQTTGADGQLTGQVDAGKVLIASIIIALILVIIIWLIKAASRSY